MSITFEGSNQSVKLSNSSVHLRFRTTEAILDAKFGLCFHICFSIQAEKPGMFQSRQATGVAVYILSQILKKESPLDPSWTWKRLATWPGGRVKNFTSRKGRPTACLGRKGHTQALIPEESTPYSMQAFHVLPGTFDLPEWRQHHSLQLSWCWPNLRANLGDTKHLETIFHCASSPPPLNTTASHPRDKVVQCQM